MVAEDDIRQRIAYERELFRSLYRREPPSQVVLACPCGTTLLIDHDDVPSAIAGTYQELASYMTEHQKHKTTISDGIRVGLMNFLTREMMPNHYKSKADQEVQP